MDSSTIRPFIIQNQDNYIMALVHIIIALLCLLGLIITIPLQKWWKSPATQKTFGFWHVTRLRLWIVCLFCLVMVSQDRYRKEKRHSYSNPNAAQSQIDTYKDLYNQALKLPIPVDEDDMDMKGISKKDSEYHYDDIAVMRYYWGGKDVETKQEKGRRYVKSLKDGTWIEVENFTLLQLGAKFINELYDDEYIDYEIYRYYIDPKYSEDGGRYVNDFPCAEDLSAPIEFWDCKGVIDGEYVDTAVKLYYEGIHGHLNIVDRGDEIFVMIRDDARGWVPVDRLE